MRTIIAALTLATLAACGGGSEIESTPCTAQWHAAYLVPPAGDDIVLTGPDDAHLSAADLGALGLHIARSEGLAGDVHVGDWCEVAQ